MALPLLLKSLLAAGAQYAVAEALLRGDGVKRRAGRMLGGVVLLLLAGILGCFSAVFLLASLFFKLADLAVYIMPALVTGLVGLAIVIVLVFEGIRQLRK